MRFMMVLVLCARVAAAEEVPDEQLYRCKKKVGEVEVTFKPETELKDLITWVMGFTCKNFAFDPRIIATGKKVTLIVPNKMAPAEAYQTFLAALATMGLTVVPDGNVMQVVEASAARHAAVPIYAKDLPPTTDQVIRFVYRPQHAQPETMQAAFATEKSDAGDIQVVGPLLVITDYATHVRDMLSLAKVVDAAGGNDGIYTIPVKHATATALQQELATVLGKDTKLLVDERTNTLVYAGTEATYRRILGLVDRLDIAVETESGATFHVYPLGSAIAEELAKTLNEAVTSDKVALAGKVKIMPDKPTNKLLVIASGRDFLAIRDVIRQLDEPRRQVYIEAMILEVQLDRTLDLGASVHFGDSTSDGKGAVMGGIQQPALRSTDLSTLATASGLVGALIGPTINGSDTLFGKSIPSYGVLIQALATRSNTNILSEPNIIALDNEEAKFMVGVNIPYRKGVLPTSTTTATSSLTTNIDRQDLSLELSIKPHITLDDSVLLELSHSSKDLGNKIEDLGYSWSTRSFQTRVVVHDQSTVVIGGLVQDREVISESKVPLLGDIPLLGYLFSYKSREKKKTNLVIMLTPYIVKDEGDLERLRERKIREHEEFTRSFRVLDGMKYEQRVDYRRKRGVVEEINRAVSAVADDVEARGQLVPPPAVTRGAIE